VVVFPDASMGRLCSHTLYPSKEYERQLDRLDDRYVHPLLAEPNEDHYLERRELSREEIALIKDGFV